MNFVLDRAKTYSTFVFLFILLFSFVYWGTTGFYVLAPGQQALVIKLGKIDRVIQKSGLYWHFRGIQSIIVYPKQMLSADVEKTELTLKGQERVIVDVFARYQITDPKLFYASVFSKDGPNANEFTASVPESNRLFRNSVAIKDSDRFTSADLEYSSLPSIRLASNRIRLTIIARVMDELGRCKLVELLSDKREQSEENIKNKVSMATADMGITVLEVRIKQISYPPYNMQAIESKMCTGPNREAVRLKAEAERHYNRMAANANVEASKIKCKAEEDGSKMIGEAEYAAKKNILDNFSKCPRLAELMFVVQVIDALTTEDKARMKLILSNENLIEKAK